MRDDGTNFEYLGLAPFPVAKPSGALVVQPVDLTTPDAISEMLEMSRSVAVLLYKHSTSCPISGYAWYEVEDCLRGGENPPTCFRVTVQSHPDISHSIAEMLDVVHHTPQVIILRDARASYVASHWRIRRQTLQRELLGGGSADSAG